MPGHFHRNPLGRVTFGVFLRCLLGQYRNGYCRFARALKNTKIHSGKWIAIYHPAHLLTVRRKAVPRRNNGGAAMRAKSLSEN